jgi:hypothetical protein
MPVALFKRWRTDASSAMKREPLGSSYYEFIGM